MSDNSSFMNIRHHQTEAMSFPEKIKKTCIECFSSDLRSPLKFIMVLADVVEGGNKIPKSEKHQVMEMFHRSSIRSKGIGLVLILERALTKKLRNGFSPSSNDGIGISEMKVSLTRFLCISILMSGIIFSTHSANGQMFNTGIGAEKTIAGIQYSSSMLYRTGREWGWGIFFQSGLSGKTAKMEVTDQFYGIQLSAPIVKSSGILFFFDIRSGFVNRDFLVIVPGIETVIRLNERTRISFGSCIRMQHLAASAKVYYKIF